MTDRSRLIGAKDSNPHPSVQAWSRGPVFPCVIARIEHHYSNGDVDTVWEVILPGTVPGRFTNYDAAEHFAKAYNAEMALQS